MSSESVGRMRKKKEKVEVKRKGDARERRRKKGLEKVRKDFKAIRNEFNEQ